MLLSKYLRKLVVSLYQAYLVSHLKLSASDGAKFAPVLTTPCTRILLGNLMI